MSVKTLRLNRVEERELGVLLAYTGQDFSHCMKELIRERLEDLADLKFIGKIKEGKAKDYISADQIDEVVNRRSAKREKH